MAVITSNAGVAELLRSWRALRRVSQLELALRADVSQRHLSFVELGRANPSRALVLRLAAELHLSLRDQNALLLAAGYAPAYPETPLEAQELLPVRHALQKILKGLATLHLRALGGQELAFFSTIATFGTARDITVAELSIESFFPADKSTNAALHTTFS